MSSIMARWTQSGRTMADLMRYLEQEEPELTPPAVEKPVERVDNPINIDAITAAVRATVADEMRKYNTTAPVQGASIEERSVNDILSEILNPREVR